MIATAAALLTMFASHAVAATPGTVVGATLTDCSNSSFAVTFDQTSISPNPPKVGTSISIVANGTARDAVSAGNLSINALYYGGQVFSQTVNLCGIDNVELPLGAGTAVINALECPVAAGSKVSVFATIPLPAIAPPGQYEIKLLGRDDSGQQAICLDLQANIQA